MMENKLISNAIVTDMIDGPYERARKAVSASPYREKIDVRKGDGIKVLKPYEVATVIIAGMGEIPLPRSYLMIGKRLKPMSFYFSAYEPTSCTLSIVG